MKNLIILISVFTSITLCFCPQNTALSQRNFEVGVFVKMDTAAAKLDSMRMLIKKNVQKAVVLTNKLYNGKDTLDTLTHQYIEVYQTKRRHSLLYDIFHHKNKDK